MAVRPFAGGLECEKIFNNVSYAYNPPRLSNSHQISLLSHFGIDFPSSLSGCTSGSTLSFCVYGTKGRRHSRTETLFFHVHFIPTASRFMVAKLLVAKNGSYTSGIKLFSRTTALPWDGKFFHNSRSFPSLFEHRWLVVSWEPP